MCLQAKLLGGEQLGLAGRGGGGLGGGDGGERLLVELEGGGDGRGSARLQLDHHVARLVVPGQTTAAVSGLAEVEG